MIPTRCEYCDRYCNNECSMARAARKEARMNVAEALAEGERKASKRPGEKLPNGATIIQDAKARPMFTIDPEENRYQWATLHIVLALNPGGFQPFAVWERVIGTQQLATGGYGPYEETFWGFYTTDLSKALEVFNGRMERHERTQDAEEEEVA